MEINIQIDQQTQQEEREIVDWLKEKFQVFLILIKVCKIKELENISKASNGALACQIMDVIYPGIIEMDRVIWSAEQEYEFVNNYKLLHSSFLKKNILKSLPVINEY